MAVRTWIGHFGISRGQAQEIGPFQGMFTRMHPGEDQVELYVLVHPALPASEEFCGQIVAVIGRLFEREALSLTGALQKAIGAAHDNLRDWNRKSLREHQVGAGVTCLVLRDTLAYLAQAGPSLAFYRSGSGFRRLTPEDSEASAVVGLGDLLQPQLTRFELAPGDLLLLTSPTLSEIADDKTIEELFSASGEQILSELYLLTRDQQEFSAFLLVCFEEPEPVSSESPEPLVEERREEETEEGKPALEPLGPVAAGEDAAWLDEEAGDTSSSSSLSETSPPAAAGTAPQRRGPGANVDYGRLFRRRRGSLPRWLLVLPVLLVAAIAMGWCLMSGGSDEKNERFSALLAQARDSYTSALAAPTLNEKRSLLEEAEAVLLDAVAIDAEEADLQALRLEISKALAGMDSVYEIGDLRLLGDLGARFGADVSARSLAVGGGAVYVLDAEGGRVFMLPLDAGGGEAEVILTEGDFLGVVEAARPLHITWWPGADGGRLLVLDAERHLFSFLPEHGARPTALRDSESWESVEGLASDGGDLYVLDSEGGQVWRYLPTEGGFDSERTAVVSGAPLKGTIGLAVSGDIYLLTEDGGIRRFSEGEEQPFAMDGLDQPLDSPASLIAGEQELIVVDGGNKRVVQFSLDGRFQRQFVSVQFKEPRAVAVDEVGGHLYLLDGNAVYETALPAPQDLSNNDDEAGEPR